MNSSVLVNSSFELESNGGVNNNTLSDAENLDGGFINVGGTASRSVVVGRRGADLAEDFENATLDSFWTTSSSEVGGRIQVTNTVPVEQGSYALVMDRGSTGDPTLNEAIWTVDLSGVTSADLQFLHTDFGSATDSGDEETSLPASFTGSVNGDGVAISDDGVNWYTILNATDIPGVDWIVANIDLVDAAADAGMTLGSDFQIKFQQFDDTTFPSDGRGYDDIRITTTPASSTEDWYEFSLSDGETSTIVMDELSFFGDSRVELYDASSNLLATSSGADNAEQIIERFQDQTSDSSPDLYYIRVVEPAEDYMLLVTRESGFDREPNSVLPASQDLAGVDQAIGYVSADAGATLSLIDSFQGIEYTGFIPPDPIIAAGPGQLVAAVNTSIAIYDKSGTELFFQNMNGPSGFFGSVGATTTVFDPWVIYDDDSERFFVIGIDLEANDKSNVFIAVSTSSTPTSGSDWHKIQDRLHALS